MVLTRFIFFAIYFIEFLQGTEFNAEKQRYLKDYCISETFRPSCFQSEVIVIERAYFGRRILGRCLENEKQEMKELYVVKEKSVGCFSDVKDVIDPMCSLKQSCEVRVAELNVDVPCYSFLRSFLEVQYSCIKVIREARDCTVELTLDKEHISGWISHKTICGAKSRPWIINSLAGQKINFTIFYASGLENNSSRYFFSETQNNQCTEGYIKDRINKKMVFICYDKYTENTSNRNNFLSESSSNEVVTFSEKRDSMFLLSLEASGCSDLIPPNDAWLKRTENEATIGCYSTRLRWKLKCVDQRWIGVIGNCSNGMKNLNSAIIDDKNEIPTDNQTIVIFGIVLFGGIFCVLITCVGVMILKKYAMKKSRVMKLIPSGTSTEHPKYTNGLTFHPKTSGTCYTTNRKNQAQQDLDGFITPKDSVQYFELNKS